MDNEQDFGFGGNAPAVFQYMPAGRSVICASVNGKPGRREVVVDAATAERLQRDLEKKLAAFAAHAKPRPCGLFDHKSGAASLIPQRFSWDEERGVLLEAVWTNAGRAAVEGRDYSYWSPSFRLNADGSVVGLQAGVEVGSLVNDPAFERIELVAAGRQEVDEPEEGVVEVNGGGAEVDAAHCNQYQHVPGCEHENEGGGNKSWQRQSKVRKAIQSGDDDAAEKAVAEVIEDAKKDGDETGARFWKEMLDSMRQEREEKKRMKEVLEMAHRRNSDNGKSKEDSSGGSVEKLKKDIERLEQDFNSKRREYAQLLKDDDEENVHLNENLSKAAEDAEQAAKKLRDARISLAKEYRKRGNGSAEKRLMLEDELDSGPWLDYGDNVKSSKVDFGSAIGVLAGRVAAVAKSDADARGAVADLAVSVRAAFGAVDAANPYGCN